MNKIKSNFEKNAVLVYFLLTILITWGGILLVAGIDGITGASQIPEAKMPVLYMATLFGPSTAGLLLTGLFEGKNGFRRLLSRLSNWRKQLKWYGFALLTAPALIILILTGLSRVSSNFLPAIFGPDNNPQMVFIGIFMGLAVGFFEELGWTGFAVPRLLKRFSILSTGLITGIVWGLWHLPLFLGSLNLSGGVSPTLYLFALLFTFLPVYRVLMVWLFDRTESLLLTMLMHAPLSASQLALIPAELSGKQLVTYNLLFTAALWLVIAAIQIFSKRLDNASLTQSPHLDF